MRSVNQAGTGGRGPCRQRQQPCEKLGGFTVEQCRVLREVAVESDFKHLHPGSKLLKVGHAYASL